tara:strand:- start:109 stop:252 length:144 start_codon:yes stop_codon:yes gene_type:complete
MNIEEKKTTIEAEIKQIEQEFAKRVGMLELLKELEEEKTDKGKKDKG